VKRTEVDKGGDRWVTGELQVEYTTGGCAMDGDTTGDGESDDVIPRTRWHGDEIKLIPATR